MRIPAEFLSSADDSEEWAVWLDGLPRLVRRLLDEWTLRPDGESTHGAAGLVTPVRTADGTAAVLKVSWPHWEAAFEHLALQRWNGDGAIWLLRADPHRYALLLERVHSTDLTTVPDLQACEIVAGFYPRLSTWCRPSHPVYQGGKYDSRCYVGLAGQGFST